MKSEDLSGNSNAANAVHLKKKVKSAGFPDAVEPETIVDGLYLSLRKTFIVIETRQDVTQVAATILREGLAVCVGLFLLFVWFFFGPPDFLEVPDHLDQRRKTP